MGQRHNGQTVPRPSE